MYDDDVQYDLDVDCIVEILRRCTLSDLASAACVSRTWHTAALLVLEDAKVDIRGLGSEKLDACRVLLARSIPCLDISSQGWEADSYVDVHESHGRVACIDSGGCVNVCARNGCSLTLVATISNTTKTEKDSEWKVFVLGATRNILTIRPNHCCNVYVEVGTDAERIYRLKHSFWPASLEFQHTLMFCMDESDPQYLYVGCSAGKVLQLDMFNKGAVSRVYLPPRADDGDVTTLIAVTVDATPLLLVATTDDSHVPCITVYESEESSTIRCPYNTRYKTLLHLDVSTHDTQCPRVLGTCENMLILWKMVRDDTEQLRLVYVTHSRTTPNIRSHSFLPRVCDDHGNLYACGLVEPSSVCVYTISSTTIQQIHHVPVFGSNPMEHLKMSVDTLTKIVWCSHPAIFLTETAAGLLLLPKKHFRFSRPSSFLHLSFL